MGRRALLAAAATLLCAAAADAAKAAMIITSDPGGAITEYERRYAMVRATGEFVVIDGPCFSACTLVLGMVPRDRVCVTERARLGFHAVWFPDMTGGRVLSAEHTRRLHDIYPVPVRDWISRRGGLTGRTLVLQGRELRSMVAACHEAFVPQPENPPRRRSAPAGHYLELSGLSNGLGRGL